LAAMWVLIFHIRLNGGAIGIDPQSFIMRGRFLQAGYFGVDIFFVLSGFIIALTYGASFSSHFKASLYPFYLKRFARVYPVHLFALSLFFLVYIASFWRPSLIPHPEHFPMSDLLAQIFLVHAWGIVSGNGWNLPSWSMSMEFLAYLTFPVLIYVVRRFGVPIFSLLSSLLIVVYFLLPYGDMGVPGIARVLSEFSFGMVISQLADSGKLGSLKSDAMTVLAVVLIVILANGIALRSSGNEYEQFIVFPAGLLIFSLDRDKFQFLHIVKSKATIYLGKISYSLYATHAFVLLVVFRFVRAEHIGTILTLTICVLAPIVFAAMTYHAIEFPCRLRLIQTLKGTTLRKSVAT